MPTVERHISEITSKQTTLTKSKFYSALDIQALEEFAPEEIVCYGIGSFSSSISQWQLALILALNRDLHAPIHAFDPMTTADDIDIMRHFNISPIAENEQAKRKVSKRTLFYMPHCEQFLYENVVAANWSAEQLPQVMLVGNHFSSYQNSQTCQTFASNSPHIKQVLEHLTCVDFPHETFLGLKHCPYAFSDMCIQYVRPLDINRIF
ncbi:hypothetical protein EV183_000814 [Coemansia sp. RSA 2336]|nr:hypothetical protein EV183_000814 [Coemansia sp. RSA 2336]